MTTLSTLRWWLVGVLALGLVGTIAELLLLEHYEDVLQLVPVILVVGTLGVLAWHVLRPNARNVRAFQGLMILFVLIGAAGVVLHFRGAAEFQLEMNADQPRWDVFTKAMRAKDPPVLAPGMMVQMGLIGLAYSYRHPAVRNAEPAVQAME